MKRLVRIPGMKIWTMLLLIGSMFTACNVLTENEEDCAVYVRFQYDMNLLETDAFSQAVNSVTLYAFDKNGVLVFQKTEEGELLKQSGYRMRLDEISRSEDLADYDFITWAGEPDNESFSIPVLTVGKSTKEDLICQLNRAGDGVVDDDLEDLFHGQADSRSITRSVSGDELVMPLVKNTNSIRIILQHVTGEPLDVNDFRFTVEDKNGKMDYKNTLMEDEMLTYKAWHTSNGYAGLDGAQTQAKGMTEINVAIAELSVARLMVDMEPILTITRISDNKEVLRIPLVDCALLFKRQKYESMDNQEFLDRADEYNFVFFLDEFDNWVSTTIIIHDWRVVIGDYELR